MDHVHFSAPSSGAITPAQQLNAQFTAIYATHQRRITALVLSQVRGDDHHLAEDLTATTFFRAWLDLHKLRATTDTGIYAWLAQIARRTVGQHYRVARNTRETAVDMGHYAYTDREFTAGPAGTLQPVRAGHQGDSDPDMDEALRRVRTGRQLVGAR